jgi:hypothetical protein
MKNKITLLKIDAYGNFMRDTMCTKVALHELLRLQERTHARPASLKCANLSHRSHCR